MLLRTVLVLAALALLTACGGSGGKKGTDPVGDGHKPVAGHEYNLKPGGVVVKPEGRDEPVKAEDGEDAAKSGSEQNRSRKSISGTSPYRVKTGTYAEVDCDVAACWLPLMERLQADDMSDPKYAAYFSALAEYSSAPMSVKVKELFQNMQRKKAGTSSATPTGPKTDPRARIYKKVVTAATMAKCVDFLETHKEYFDAVEKKYPVPREIIAALLYVETRHGEYLGSANAFWSLACMAAAVKPEYVQDGIQELPLTDAHQAWLQSKLSEKSDWAYKELKAFLVYCNTNDLDPISMPGSVYGAIGMAQFMPTNLIPYGADGDGDGIVDLFNPPDAIFSVAKYLTSHGWKKELSVDQQRKVIKRYNNLTTYANTILTLAESARLGELQTAPPDVTAELKAAAKK